MVFATSGYVPPPGIPEPVAPHTLMHPRPRLSQLDRIEEKLDLVLEALLKFGDQDEGEERPAVDLEGKVAGGPRDQSQSLG